jgi:hypothetical protein|tara:strand:- start:200 stop:601 length:402 start_codon:yes stop_codon:yes gene_type:complete
MTLYTKRFSKLIKEQDDEITDAEALETTLDDGTGAEDFDVDAPQDTSITGTQKEMYDELYNWINEMDKFSSYLNGTDNSVQTKLNMAEDDTLFDSISNAETKKIARVAMEISSLSEILKGYLAGANDPKYKYV